MRLPARAAGMRCATAVSVAAVALACGDDTRRRDDVPSAAAEAPAPAAETVAPIDPFADDDLAALRPAPQTIWPLETRDVLVDFDWHVDPATGIGVRMHEGVDLRAARGDLVLSIADGTVRSARGDRERGGTVVIDHGDGIASLYVDLLDVLVHEGLPVQRGAAVGLVDGTHESAIPHLHFAIEVDGHPVDPMLLLGQTLYRPEAAVTPPKPEVSATDADAETSGPPQTPK